MPLCNYSVESCTEISVLINPHIWSTRLYNQIGPRPSTAIYHERQPENPWSFPIQQHWFAILHNLRQLMFLSHTCNFSGTFSPKITQIRAGKWQLILQSKMLLGTFHIWQESGIVICQIWIKILKIDGDSSVQKC